VGEPLICPDGCYGILDWSDDTDLEKDLDLGTLICQVCGRKFHGMTDFINQTLYKEKTQHQDRVASYMKNVNSVYDEED